MTIAIMQPYFLPYIGYWQLLNDVDIFVIYDNIQFSKKGYFCRNNILLNGKRTIFSIPIKKDSDYLNIVDRSISDNSDKQINKILGQIKNSYKNAPFFNDVFQVIELIFKYEEKNLFKYILNSIKKINEYLEITTKIVVSSCIDINHELKSQNKVLAINEKLNATKYINSIGGVALYDKKSFNNVNIELQFLESEIPKYKQFNEDFIPYLSIIDIMMFNDKENIKIMLKKYKLNSAI